MLFGMASKDFAAYVKSLGMKLTSGHYQLGKNERTKLIKGSILMIGSVLRGCKGSRAGIHGDCLSECDERVTLDDYNLFAII